MALICPEEMGEVLMLQYIVGLTAAGPPVLHLFKEPTGSVNNTITKSLVHDCTSSGYVPFTLSSYWTVIKGANGTTAVCSEHTFSFATNASVYGYYVSNTDGDILWIERFSGSVPFDIPDGGGSISITTKLTLS